MKNVKYWNINSNACFKIIHLSNWVMKKSYFWFFVLNEFPKSKSNALKFLCPTNRIVFDPKLLIFHEKPHNFWVPIVMRKRKRIILMQWYSSIKQNLKYPRFESTRVLHTNFQKSVHLPSVRESSIFEILNILCNLRIADFWYLELYGQFWKIYSSHFHSVHVDMVMTCPFQTPLPLVFCFTFAASCAFCIKLNLWNWTIWHFLSS